MMRKLNWRNKYEDYNWIYENDASKDEPGNSRFILGTEGDNPLICFGVNPSTGYHKEPDATLQRLEEYACKHGYDSWIMLNLYPQRATNPNDLHKNFCPMLHYKNIEVISETLERVRKKQSYKNLLLWGAWGKLIYKRDYLSTCLDEIKDKAQGFEWYSHLGNGAHLLSPLPKGSKFYKKELTPLL
ncbi:MAG: DUF1643 domain-containing protein [Clostridiales bacterium]|nr:DUF1643 domain-containing protein [Clostridiales bacterium]